MCSSQYPVIVTAVAIRRGDKVLVAQRQHGHLAGEWEFTGGKLEPGESPEQCLAREIKGELGLEVRVGDVLATVYHRYATGPILLLAYDCTLGRDDGPNKQGLSRDTVRWASPEELGRLDLAPADVPIAEKLRRTWADSQVQSQAQSDLAVQEGTGGGA